jgi:hypothetical protein
MRNRTPSQADAFFLAGKAMNEACSDKNFQQMLLPFTEPKVFADWFFGIEELALEPAIPALFQHISEWGRRKQDRFRVIHDGSKPVLASQETFESMMAITGEATELVGYDRRKFSFPLRATSLEQGNSVGYPQIQIADLCAGAINHLLKCKEKGALDDLAVMIRDLCCADWVINGVIPDTAVTPEEMGTDSGDGVNPVDSVQEYLHRKQQN